MGGSIDGGVHLDRSTVTVANLPASRRNVLAVETKTVPARNWELGVGVRGRNAGDVVATSVTVAIVVTAAGSDFTVSRNIGTVVIEIESTADSAVDTSEDRDVVSSKISIERATLSTASNSSSRANVGHVGLYSSVAVELSRSLGWHSGGIKTSIAITTTSHESILDGCTAIGKVETTADGSRIASVELGSDTGSVGEGRVHAEESTVSVARHPTSIGHSHSVDEDSGVAGNWVLGRTDRSGGVNSLKTRC